jgi:hypothetical protein
MGTMKEYTQNNLRYPKAGELIEIAYDVYSRGQLKRVNLPGVDLICTKTNATYESKVTQFVNKSQMAVRNVILKNARSKMVANQKLADYFIFTDVKKGKCCCVPSSKLYNYDFTLQQATVKAHCNPEIGDFFMTGYEDLSDRDYFAESEAFDYAYVKSFIPTNR